MKSFRDLEIFQLAFSLAIEIHKLSLLLPKYELYEQGSQIRRSSKSIKDNIVEGYGRRKYKNEFIRFLIFAHSSCDESFAQLMMIKELFPDFLQRDDLIEANKTLGRKLNIFIQYVEKNWR